MRHVGDRPAKTTAAALSPAFGGRTGLSLIELLLAFALFAAIVAIGMQAYMTSYTGMIVQEQRAQAMHVARGVLSNIRETRNHPEFTFPDAIIARYPDGVPVADVRSPRTSALGGAEVITVEYADPTANPLPVRVVVAWRDPRNRPMTMDITTLVTDR